MPSSTEQATNSADALMECLNDPSIDEIIRPTLLDVASQLTVIMNRKRQEAVPIFTSIFVGEGIEELKQGKASFMFDCSVLEEHLFLEQFALLAAILSEAQRRRIQEILALQGGTSARTFDRLLDITKRKSMDYRDPKVLDLFKLDRSSIRGQENFFQDALQRFRENGVQESIAPLMDTERRLSPHLQSDLSLNGADFFAALPSKINDRSARTILQELPLQMEQAATALYETLEPAFSNRYRPMQRRPTSVDATELKEVLHDLCCLESVVIRSLDRPTPGVPVQTLHVHVWSRILHSVTSSLFLRFLAIRYPYLLLPPNAQRHNQRSKKDFNVILSLQEKIVRDMQAFHKKEPHIMPHFLQNMEGAIVQMWNAAYHAHRTMHVGFVLYGGDMKRLPPQNLPAVKSHADYNGLLHITDFIFKNDQTMDTCSSEPPLAFSRGIRVKQSRIVRVQNSDTDDTIEHIERCYCSATSLPGAGPPLQTDEQIISPETVLGKHHPLPIMMRDMEQTGRALRTDLQREDSSLGLFTALEAAVRLHIPLRFFRCRDSESAGIDEFLLFTAEECDRLEIQFSEKCTVIEHEEEVVFLQLVHFPLPDSFDQLRLYVLNDGGDGDRDVEDPNEPPPTAPAADPDYSLHDWMRKVRRRSKVLPASQSHT